VNLTQIPPEQLLLVALESLILATKFQEHKALTFGQACQVLPETRFLQDLEPEFVRRVEAEILRKLQFNLCSSNCFDLIGVAIRALFPAGNIPQQLRDKIQHIALISLSSYAQTFRTSFFGEEVRNSLPLAFSQSEIVSAAVYLASKIYLAEACGNGSLTKAQFVLISEALACSEERVLLCTQIIINLV